MIIPRLSLSVYVFAFLCALCGIVVASVYGVLHDQLTYSLSPEYYTKFKFYQFGYAEGDASSRLLVVKIGVLATWWVGLIAGWLLGRAAYIEDSKIRRWKRFLGGMFSLVGAAILTAAGFAGFFHFFGNSQNSWAQSYFGLADSELEPFLLVGNIHNGSYLGAILGLIGAMVVLVMSRKKTRDMHL